jgi:GT2 family glycosyltransferase
VLVTVVILTKNAEPFLEDTLPAIFNQETDFDFDVLVIDSGSKDRTLEILAANPVRVMQIPPETFNHGETRNLAVREANPASQFIVLLSQDAIPGNLGWLQNLVRPLRENPQVAGVFSRHVPRPDAPASVVRQLVTGIQCGGEMRLDKKMPETPEEFRKHRSWYNFFSNTSSAIRREVWVAIPFEKTDFAEDALWADKVIQSGYTIVFEPQSVVIHSHHYGILEQFRQNVDHACAMNKLFQPEEYQRKGYWLRRTAGIPVLAIKDIRYIYTSPFFNQRSVGNKLYMILISLPWEVATTLGAWVGAKLPDMPPRLQILLSRQARIKSL